MSSQKRKRTYYYNAEWEEEFCFIEYNGKVICLICNKVITLLKQSNLERHFLGLHSNFNVDFPLKSELRKVKIEILKSSISKQQRFFSKSKTLSKSATVASLTVSHLLAKKKKPFIDSEMIKEAML